MQLSICASIGTSSPVVHRREMKRQLLRYFTLKLCSNVQLKPVVSSLVYMVACRQGERVIWTPLAMTYYDDIQVRLHLIPMSSTVVCANKASV